MDPDNFIIFAAVVRLRDYLLPRQVEYFSTNTAFTISTITILATTHRYWRVLLEKKERSTRVSGNKSNYATQQSGAARPAVRELVVRPEVLHASYVNRHAHTCSRIGGVEQGMSAPTPPILIRYGSGKDPPLQRQLRRRWTTRRLRRLDRGGISDADPESAGTFRVAGVEGIVAVVVVSGLQQHDGQTSLQYEPELLSTIKLQRLSYADAETMCRAYRSHTIEACGKYSDLRLGIAMTGNELRLQDGK
ncbi:hypothetical protein CHU98_g11594 [Xylaria longipes]|nr:hypothetical protein CHU98_g11594 [Xylaria longipes]